MNTFLKNTIIILVFLYCVPLISQLKDGGTYKNRRTEFLNRIEDNSIAVFESAEKKGRNSDTDYEFKQDASFQYFTGIIESNSFLMLFKPGIELDGKKINEILFVREKNAMMEQWTGEILGKDKATLISNPDTIFYSVYFTETLKKYLTGRKTLYLGKSDYSPKKDPVADIRYNFYDERKKKLKELFPQIDIKSVFDIIADMREIKDDQEIQKIRKAVNATICGYIEAMKSCEPDMYEYDIEAIIEYSFKRNGCMDVAFPSIVGSGKNGLVLHYEKNDSRMLSGNLLLMDIGAECDGYSADLSRTIPVNGKFTAEQKEIYNIVLKASEETIKIMLPGAKKEDIEKKTLNTIAEGLLNLGIIKDKKEARKFMPHGVSHNFGLDVHDVSTSKPLRAGQTLTIEPGIYIPLDSKDVDKKYWGIGIRIEDDILITWSGNEILTRDAPKSIEAIEKIMTEKGIGNYQIGNYKK